MVRIDELKLNKPLLIKMPVDLGWDEFKLLLDVILRHKCQGVVISNLTKDRSNINDDASDEVEGEG